MRFLPLVNRSSQVAFVAALIGAAALVSGRFASAEESPVRGIDLPGCKALVAKVLRTTGGRYERASPSGNNSFLAVPNAKDLILECSSYQRPSASLVWPGAFPPNGFFATVVAAGVSLTREKAPVLLRAAHRCHVEALKDADETSQVLLPHAELDCQAFTHDGGSVNITVSPGRDDPLGEPKG